MKVPHSLHRTFRNVKRFRKVILPVALVALVGCWVAVKYDSWLGNPEEPEYEALNGPGRVLLTFGNEDELSRNVSWAGGRNVQDSHLELIDLTHNDTSRIEAEGEVFHSRSGQMAFYHAKLRNLKEHTSYKYRAVIQDSATVWYSFSTPQHNRSRYSFMYLGDIQDSIGGVINATLKEALKRNPECEFMLFAGDLLERPADCYWAEMFRTLDSIGQSMPILNVTGNHDYLKAPIYRLERRFSLVFSYFLDSMVGNNQLYTLKYQDIQFFILDGTREFLFLPTQRIWLQEQLLRSHAKWKIVVIHQPLLSVRGKSKNLIQKMAFNGLIEDYGVDMVLQGHEHAYARTTALDQDGRPCLPLYFISHCSTKDYRIEFDDRFQKFGLGKQFYQKVSVHGDTLGISVREADTHAVYDSMYIVNRSGVKEIHDLGKNLKETVEFRGVPQSKKDKEFFRHIQEYKKNHPDRFKK